MGERGDGGGGTLTSAVEKGERRSVKTGRVGRARRAEELTGLGLEKGMDG